MAIYVVLETAICAVLGVIESQLCCFSISMLFIQSREELAEYTVGIITNCWLSSVNNWLFIPRSPFIKVLLLLADWDYFLTLDTLHHTV